MSTPKPLIFDAPTDECLAAMLRFSPMLGNPAKPNEEIPIELSRIKSTYRHRGGHKTGYRYGRGGTIKVSPEEYVAMLRAGALKIYPLSNYLGRVVLLQKSAVPEGEMLRMRTNPGAPVFIPDTTVLASEALIDTEDLPAEPMTGEQALRFLLQMQKLNDRRDYQSFFTDDVFEVPWGNHLAFPDRPRGAYLHRNTLYGTDPDADPQVFRIIPQKDVKLVVEGVLVQHNGVRVAPTPKEQRPGHPLVITPTAPHTPPSDAPGSVRLVVREEMQVAVKQIAELIRSDLRK